MTLIKTGAVTHSFNMEQRFLELSFTVDPTDGNLLKVKGPLNANLATPGRYYLFVINVQWRAVGGTDGIDRAAGVSRRRHPSAFLGMPLQDQAERR